MPPRGATAAAQAAEKNPIPKTPGGTSESTAVHVVQVEEEDDADIPFDVELQPRKISRTEAGSSSAMTVVAAMARELAFNPPPPPSPPPVITEIGAEQGADSKATPEGEQADDSNLWLSKDWTTPPVMNPRQILLNTSVDRRDAHIDRTYMHLFRASTVLADYKQLLKDHETALAEIAGLNSRIGSTEALEAELAAAKGEVERLNKKVEDVEAARSRARKARVAAEAKLEEEKKKIADAEARAAAAEERVRNLEESSRAAEEQATVAEERNIGLQSEVTKLRDECQWLENEQVGAVEDTWINCLTQLRFFYPHLRFDESKITLLRYVEDGVVMEIINGKGRRMDPQPEYPLPPPADD